MKFDPCLAQQFLNVKTTSTFITLLVSGLVGSSLSHNLEEDFVSVSCPQPNLPNCLWVSISWPQSFSFSWAQPLLAIMLMLSQDLIPIVVHSGHLFHGLAQTTGFAFAFTQGRNFGHGSSKV